MSAIQGLVRGAMGCLVLISCACEATPEDKTVGEPPEKSAVAPAPPKAPSSLKVAGTTYAMAQQVRWLNDQRFLVGRWDGTITVFESKPGAKTSPQLRSALAMPGGQGVQMLVVKDAHQFVSSGDADSLFIWRAKEEAQFAPRAQKYPTKHGVAVSGLFVTHEAREYLVTGHEQGDLLIWSVEPELQLKLVRAVNLRMEKAIDYLHADEPLRHIRGLAGWKDGAVIAGGEDGGLHQVRLADGAILAQRLFNPQARLGVNDLFVDGNDLLVVNCALDRNDRNAWLFELGKNTIKDRDSENLLQKQDAKKIFAFDVATYREGDSKFALISTKEGLLWRSRFDGGEFRPLDNVALGRFNYGNAIDLHEPTRRIAVAGISVRVVQVAGD